MTPYQYLAVVTGFQYCCNLKWISVRLSTFLLAASQWDELLITGSFLRECVSSVSVCMWVCVCVSTLYLNFCELRKLSIVPCTLDAKAAENKTKQRKSLQHFLVRSWENTHVAAGRLTYRLSLFLCNAAVPVQVFLLVMVNCT